MTDPTPDEVERAKKWAAMHGVELAKTGPHYYFANLPIWLRMVGGFDSTSDESAWSSLALALRPVFASIAPLVREECADVCSKYADERSSPASTMEAASQAAALILAGRIRSMS